MNNKNINMRSQLPAGFKGKAPGKGTKMGGKEEEEKKKRNGNLAYFCKDTENIL